MIDGWFLRFPLIDRALRRLPPSEVIALLSDLIDSSEGRLALYDGLIGPVPLDELDPRCLAGWEEVVCRRLALVDAAVELRASLAPLVRSDHQVVPLRLRRQLGELLVGASRTSEADAWWLMEAISQGHPQGVLSAPAPG